MASVRLTILASALLCISLAAGLAQTDPQPAPTAAQAEFFESRVRPVLAARCYNCHGSRLQSGGLRLDSRASILMLTAKGSRPVVPGSPAQSAIIKAVRYDGAVRMPPLGLVASSFCACMISILGSKEMRWLESLAAALAMTAFCVGVFVYLLQLPFQLWPWY